MLAAALWAALALATPPSAAPWQRLEAGLELAWLDGPPGAPGDGKILVVRIDPAHFELRLLNASAPGEGGLHTARAWAERTGAAAAINAGLYQADYLTSVSQMRSRDHVNQRRVSREKAFLAFDPLEPGIPAVRIVDRECEDVDRVTSRYGALVQSIRMVSCQRQNVWAESPRRASAAAIGLDGKGRILFVHARSAWPVHALVDALLALPLDLRRAMYVEGGPEAQLYVRAGKEELERVGAFESAPGAAPGEAWPVPNVIAAIRRTGPRSPSPRGAGRSPR
ncbi:MAG TPA: phosphodiester glycosidase family protein [Anaeromyxobacter sp.]|nr:phosphodiester glycosidase family protein [Anaeromyxobacter sp.]